MKRFHVHVAVKDLQSSIRFYSTLFGAEPTVSKSDYAKWMVDDPRINFAISQRGEAPGINHLGLQVDSDEELEALRAQAASADLSASAESGTCCYARSNKYWYTDPQGVAWETYHTLAQVEYFGGDSAAPQCGSTSDGESQAACCTPVQASGAGKAERVRAACCA